MVRSCLDYLRSTDMPSASNFKQRVAPLAFNHDVRRCQLPINGVAGLQFADWLNRMELPAQCVRKISRWNNVTVDG
jgi:hypothetical protein